MGSTCIVYHSIPVAALYYEVLEEVEGLDTYKIIADMVKKALDNITDNGELREEV